MRALGVIVVILLVGGIIWVILSSSAGASPIAYANLSATNSGVTGSVNFIPTSDGQSSSVTVNLHGLQRDAVYAATINQGDCLGPRLFILNAVPGDSNGNGSSTTTVPGEPQSDWYVATHATASPDAPLVACGQVHVTGATGPYVPASSTSYPSGNPVYQQPYQLPNGGGGPPRTPIPTPVAGH